MGKYINSIDETRMGASFASKCEVLESKGATRVTGREYDPNLVCVVDNGFFAAAAWAYSENEWNQFKKPDGRTKYWYILPNAETHVDKD